MNVAALAERLDEGRVSGQMGHDPKLDLGVIGHQEDPALPWNEAGADRFSPGGSHGNVLEVWLGRAEAPGGCASLVEAGVDTASPSVDPFRKGVDVGALQLLELRYSRINRGKSCPMAASCSRTRRGGRAVLFSEEGRGSSRTE